MSTTPTLKTLNAFGKNNINNKTHDMQKSQFKHKVGDIIETSDGRFGKIVKGEVIYRVSFSASLEEGIGEHEIITPEKQKRIRKKKEEE